MQKLDKLLGKKVLVHRVTNEGRQHSYFWAVLSKENGQYEATNVQNISGPEWNFRHPLFQDDIIVAEGQAITYRM